MRLYNTLTLQKDEFVPIKEGEVSMYSCGPTVYNFFHIGNARPFIVFDALRRYFEYCGYKVTFVQNFTDVDDKLINRAKEEGITVSEVAEKYIEEYFKDAKALGIKPATIHPRATENIDAIISVVETLIEKGYAYESEGDVYFSPSKFENYGELGHQPLEDLAAGARISVGEKKREPMDFALWKAQKEDSEIAWDSPWGKGRPGWHIECSAMVNRFLGHTIDIHSGGKDLIFPHHENEKAQSECANGVKFANYWLHNGYININNEKMSKSKGNFFTVRDILKKYDGEVIRFFLLSAHYRNPVNFSDDLIASAKAGLDRLYTCLERLENADSAPSSMDLDAYRTKFKTALDDDFNTADAISVLFELVRQINSSVDKGEGTGGCRDLLLELGGVLGILSGREKETLDSDIEALIQKRQQARRERNFAEADKIRDELLSMGIILEDTREGIKWRRQ